MPYYTHSKLRDLPWLNQFMPEPVVRLHPKDAEARGIADGDPVRVFADAGDKGSRQYEGRVIWIADKAEFTPKTIQTRDERANLVYAVKIAVPNDGLLKIGMYADVKFGK